MLRKLLQKIWPSLAQKLDIKYQFTVPPHAEFHAHGVTVGNDTEDVVDIWADKFPDRRKDLRVDTLKEGTPLELKENNK